MIEVTNEAGRRFQVRCIRKGDRFGLNRCLTHDQDDPLIEFTDVTPAGGPGPVAEQGFMARYPARVILNRDDGRDLWLVGQNVAWRLSPEQVRVVREWVRISIGGEAIRPPALDGDRHERDTMR